jgi:diguanylate cyclase (GGDEF)-like protein
VATAGWHPTLQRQLKRLGLDAARPDVSRDVSPGAAPDRAPGSWPAVLPALLERVSRAYTEADQDRYLLERSQEVASREMGELHAQLAASQARLASLLSLSSDWVWEQDAGLRFNYVSSHTTGVGLELAALLDGKHALLDLEVQGEGGAAQFEALVAARSAFRNIVCGVREQGQPRYYVRISGEPVFVDDEFRGYRGVGSDVTQVTLAEQRVQQLARYDVLTGVANRSMFMQQLDHALARARRAGMALSVFFIDLDRFKAVNDTLGHDAGDELLKAVAARLTRLLRGADIVGRLGGDEFVVLLDGNPDAATLTKIAGRALTELAEPLHLLGRPVQVSASLGISRFPDDGQDAATLLKCADTAMYLAKARGKNNFQFFTPRLAERSAAEMTLEGELRQAIQGHELRLHYQPKFDVRSGALVGMEALVRWQHPQRGLLAPGAFIAMAEESGLIVPMGRWVLEAACRQLRDWRNAALAPPRCSVNVSARQFSHPALVDEVRHAMAAAAVPASALEIEVTESVLMADPERAQQSLKRLHGLGVHIAIDDFGTGYSSLSYLKRFPAQTLKIDRSFVDGLPLDRDDAAITRAVISLAHSLDMRVVAEGVETESQLQFLAEAGCDEAQGFLLGRPLVPERLAELLAGAGSSMQPCTPPRPLPAIPPTS